MEETLIRGAELDCVRGAGYAMVIERPEEVAALVEDFLARHPL